jgi:hypothetical protein
VDLSKALVLALDGGRGLERVGPGGEELIVRRWRWEELVEEFFSVFF